MHNEQLYQKSFSYLHTLCRAIPERCVGSRGNRQATDFFARQISSLGWQTEVSELDAVDWENGGAALQAALNDTLANFDGIGEGAAWVQGDHSMFIQQGCPAVAVSSQWFLENMESQDITHTPKDNADIVDCRKLVEIAQALARLIQRSCALSFPPAPSAEG